MPDEDGVTFREKANQAYEPGDPLAPEEVLEAQRPCPDGFEHIWGYWLDLSRTRQSGFASPAPLTYSEIDAWSTLKPDVYLSSKIVELIIQSDGVFRRVWSDRNKVKEE